MKKALSLAFALVLVFALAVPAFAGTIVADDGTAEATVTYAVTEGWEVTVPASITATTATATGANNVTISGKLADGASVAVTVSGSGELTLVDGEETLDYTLYVNGAEYEDVIATLQAGTASVGALLEAIVVEPAGAVAGSYTDTLTFTASYTPAAE
ncbi:MAG: hypothetical protein E7640_04800 [Ruminococcaceae bacterium]|nr:hypothetical protein [Oscillospiraceae bacterium]